MCALLAQSQRFKLGGQGIGRWLMQAWLSAGDDGSCSWIQEISGTWDRMCWWVGRLCEALCTKDGARAWQPL